MTGTRFDRRTALKAVSCAGLAALVPRVPLASAPAGTDDFWHLDSVAQAALVRSGDVTAVELARAAIRRIERLDGRINAVITPTFESALERAQSGLPDGAFTGVPYLFKDLMEYAGHRTAFGSRAMLGHVSDTTHVFGARALQGGLNVLGKTNTPELGLLGTTEPLAFGPTRNPWDLSRSAGGSSGGAAAAVAAGMVASAQGSDGGGSLRIPASCCGVFALKPSRGREVAPELPPAWQLTVKGHITRSVRDSAALHALTERQEADSPFPPTGLVSRASDRRLKIGLVMNGINGKAPAADVAAEILATADLCRSCGHDVAEARFPFDGEQLRDAFVAIWSSYAYEFKTMLEEQTGAVDFADILEPWTLYMDDYYRARGGAHFDSAVRVFADIGRKMEKMLHDFDVLLSPVLSTAAPKLGEQGPLVDGDRLIRSALDYVNYTPVYNISGQPAMSVPLGRTPSGLPVGSQFAAKRGDERSLFELAYELEEARPWYHRWAPHSAADSGSARPF